MTDATWLEYSPRDLGQHVGETVEGMLKERDETIQALRLRILYLEQETDHADANGPVRAQKAA